MVMKYVTNSGTCVELGLFASMWLKAKLLFSRKARSEFASMGATLDHIEELQAIRVVREKSEAHLALMQEIEDGRPEVVVIEGSIDEYNDVIGNTTAPGMESVNYDSGVLDELYADVLDKRIAEETPELAKLGRRD